MDLDVIEATAEALPLELLNATNKELTAQLSHCEQLLDEKNRGIQDQRRRLQFMKEHLGNVRAEIVNTQSLAESKKRECDSEESMYRIIERECSRLQQRRSQIDGTEEETREHITSLQSRIFEGNLRMEELKSAMDFNQEALEQWDAARRQKEEDELAVAQYSKQDEARIRQMRLNMEKLEGSLRDLTRQLNDEVIATQSAQVDLDRCAAEYRRVHGDRSNLLGEWEQVVRAIAERDQAIRVAAEQYSDGIEWLSRRLAVKKEVSDELDALQEENKTIEWAIKVREKEAQQRREAVPPLARQLTAMEDELEVTREQATRAMRERQDRLTRVRGVGETIAKKALELERIAGRREAASKRLAGEALTSQDLEQQTTFIAEMLADTEAADRGVVKQIEQLKRALFESKRGLHAVREVQTTQMVEIQGAQAQGRNLNAKIGQLDGEYFAQQEVLYNIEFSVQQMEKKVSRAKGERTDSERRELEEKIHLLQTTLDELEHQNRILDVQVKRVREELRHTKREIDTLEQAKQRAEERALDLTLQCTHGEQENKHLEREREDHLVRVDTMELQLRRLQRQRRQRSDELVDLEDRKRQLRVDVAEREAEIAVHHQLLRVEARLAEEERRRLADEWRERQRARTAVRNRHNVLVGQLDPREARLSQAELVVAAAKEREDLQYRGDALDARIKRIEREMLKLEKMIAVLKGSNVHFRHQYDTVADDDEEVRTRRVLQEKFRELQALMSRRALETNDYHALQVTKRAEQSQAFLARDQAAQTLNGVQAEFDQLTARILEGRERAIRYEQAIEKIRALVDPSVAADIALTETRERLERVVHRLLECTQRAGPATYERARHLLVASDVPWTRNETPATPPLM